MSLDHQGVLSFLQHFFKLFFLFKELGLNLIAKSFILTLFLGISICFGPCHDGPDTKFLIIIAGRFLSVKLGISYR